MRYWPIARQNPKALLNLTVKQLLDGDSEKYPKFWKRFGTVRKASRKSAEGLNKNELYNNCMIRLPGNFTERPDMVIAALDMWDLHEREQQESKLEDILATDELTAKDVDGLNELRDELYEVFRVVDTYNQPSPKTPKSLESTLGRATAVQLQFSQKEESLYNHIHQSIDDYFSIAGQDPAVDRPLLEKAHRELDLLEIYDGEHANEQRQRLKRGARQAKKHKNRQERDLEQHMYDSFEEEQHKFWSPQEETKEMRRDRLEGIRRSAEHIAEYAAVHGSAWHEDADTFLRRVDEAYDKANDESRANLDEELAKDNKKLVKKGIFTLGIIAATTVATMFYLRNEDTINALANKPPIAQHAIVQQASPEFLAQYQANQERLAQLETKIEQLTQTTPIQTPTGPSQDLYGIPRTIIASAQIHTEDRFFSYTDLEANRFYLFDRKGASFTKVMDVSISDGENTHKGRKTKEWDKRTPEGDFGIQSIERYSTNSHLGSWFIRAQTPWQGNGISGTNNDEYLNAIENGWSVTKGGVVMRNEDVTRFRNIIQGYEGSTRIINEKPSNPIYGA
ncbi:L,D-transpeptidase [Candidatus Woesearchaeota archaeon]|nr:L,D-transpeptidase [Candidatus Woesearchaeota archaeon]